MYYHAQRAFDLLHGVAEDAYPGCLIEDEQFTASDTVKAFGIAQGNALTLILCDTTNVPDDQWSIQLSSGLIVDAPEVSNALVWANQKNRATSIGKYYCAVDWNNQLAAVVYENFIWAGLFNLVFDGPHGPGTFKILGDWVRFNLYNNVNAAANDIADLSQTKLGGQYFTPNEQGLWTLLQVASG